MKSGLCRMTDLDTTKPNGDPMVDLADLCDMNEILIVDAINQNRANVAAEKKAKRKNR